MIDHVPHDGEINNGDNFLSLIDKKLSPLFMWAI